MRILLLVDCYLPSTKSSAHLMHDLATGFRDAGQEVRIAFPDPELTEQIRVDSDEGIEVLRIRSPQIKGAANVLRALHEVRLSSLFWRAARDYFDRKPCDLIVYYSPTIFFGPLVRRLKLEWGAKSYLILRDIFPQWALDAGMLREWGLPYRFFRMMEKRQYAAADRIGVQSPANLRYFEQRGWNREYRLEVLWNWTSPAVNRPGDGCLRARMKLQDKVVFVYGGNIGVAQDMDNVLRLAGALTDLHEAHIILIGDGSEVGRLKRQVAKKELRNVSFLGPMPQARYLAALSEFDIGLITLDGRLKTQNFPGKVLGYLNCGLPMLASINAGNDLKDVLERHDAGLVTVNGDDAGFERNARRLVKEPELRLRLGENGERMLQMQFSTERAVRQILDAARSP